MRVLVVGGGSMGKRRIRCLLANGVTPEHIRVVELRKERRAEVKQKHDVDGFDQLETGLEWEPDAVIVSVPGAYHMPVCLAAARAGKHVFCEVPLSTSLEGTEELETLVKRKSLVMAPGCQPVFHPVLRQASEWIKDPKFGKPLIVNYETGQYLPDWHPYEDYRSFYASSARMGGGNLDVIAQEMNVTRLLIDETPEHVYCRASRLSSLEIDGYDCQQILARTSSGIAMSLHFDLIQRAGYSMHRIVSEQGTITIEHGQARRYLATTKTWEMYVPPEGFVYEQCYIREIGCFLRCIEGKDRWPVPLNVAVDTVKFLLAIQKSAAQQQAVSVFDIVETVQ